MALHPSGMFHELGKILIFSQHGGIHCSHNLTWSRVKKSARRSEGQVPDGYHFPSVTSDFDSFVMNLCARDNEMIFYIVITKLLGDTQRRNVISSKSGDKLFSLPKRNFQGRKMTTSRRTHS